MQHVISYLHLPLFDLTKLDNIKDVTGNDGEKVEHHGQSLR